MAEVTSKSPTQKLYVAAARAIKGEATFDKFHSIGLDKAAMSGYDEETYALTTIADEAGLGVTAATVTNEEGDIASDTVQAEHKFTAGSKVDVTITGFGVFPAAANSDMLMWGEFDDGQPMKEDDELTVTGKCQFEDGS